MDLTVRVFRPDGLGNPHVALAIDAGGIDIGGDANGASASTHTATVANGSAVDLTITQSGYHTFSVTIDDVYMSDKTIDIVLVPVISDILDADYNRPTPYFFYFQDPCSFQIDFYNASSFSGETSWYINNEEYIPNSAEKGTVDFCSVGEYQIKVRNITYDIDGTDKVVRWDRQWATSIVGETGNTVAQTVAAIETYLDDDTNTNVTIVEYRVCITLDVSIAVQPNCEEETCCYARGEEVTIEPTWELNRVGSDPALHIITWKVIDPEGLELEFNQTSFPLNASIVDINLPFTLDKLGVYTVTATIEDTECNTTFEKTISIETCNFIFIEYIGCNSYRVENRSSATTFSFNIDNIEGLDQNINVTLEPGENTEITFDSFGLYVLRASYERNDEIVEEDYVLNNYCELEECISKYILDLLCQDEVRCDPCPPAVELNQMLLFYNTYFMKINKVYSLNNFFTPLEDEDLSELTTIDQVMQKLKNFCDRRGCIQDDCSSFPAGREVYDWAGQQSNKDKSCNCSPKSSGSYYNKAKPGYCGTCGGKS